MGQVLDLGRRVALHPMDAHCHDITVALYRDHLEDGRPVYRFHSYSRHPDAARRLAFLAAAACALGGMDAAPGRPASVVWPCGSEHPAAVRRLFVEVSKLPGPALPPARPLALEEAKSAATFAMTALGGGAWRLSASGPGELSARLRAIAGGFAKLAGMAAEEGAEPVLRFPCGHDHAALVALLLPRALNARAAIREEEQALSRGILVAPSAQSAAS